MTREEEIRQEMSKIAGTHPDWNKNDCMRMGFYEGAKWADAHPDARSSMVALLSDDAAEREVAFCDAWFAENNQFPTFGHAIEWADRTMVERAICFIEDAVCDATIETGNMARLIENFKESMGYENRD